MTLQWGKQKECIVEQRRRRQGVAARADSIEIPEQRGSDGDFGLRSEMAVKAFQSNKTLDANGLGHRSVCKLANFGRYGGRSSRLVFWAWPKRLKEPPASPPS